MSGEELEGEIESSTSSPIGSYRDLRIWNSAMSIACLCYRLTERYPQSELYGLVSQTRRAAVSVPANIAEGWGRNSQRQLVQFCEIANGSRTELETHLLLAKHLGFGEADAIDKCLEESEILGRMIRALIKRITLKDHDD